MPLSTYYSTPTPPPIFLTPYCTVPLLSNSLKIPLWSLPTSPYFILCASLVFWSFEVFIVLVAVFDDGCIFEKSEASSCACCSKSSAEGPKHRIFLLLTLARYQSKIVTPNRNKTPRRMPIQRYHADRILPLPSAAAGVVSIAAGGVAAGGAGGGLVEFVWFDWVVLLSDCKYLKD